jgi:hypothetical protein
MGVSLSILHKHVTTPGGTLKEEDFRTMLVEVLDSIHGISSSFPDLEFTDALQWATPFHEKIFTVAQMHSAALQLSVTETAVHTAPTVGGITAYSCEKNSKFAFVRVRSMRWFDHAHLRGLYFVACLKVFDILTLQACLAPQVCGHCGRRGGSINHQRV